MARILSNIVRNKTKSPKATGETVDDNGVHQTMNNCQDCTAATVRSLQSARLNIMAVIRGHRGQIGIFRESKHFLW